MKLCPDCDAMNTKGRLQCFRCDYIFSDVVELHRNNLKSSDEKLEEIQNEIIKSLNYDVIEDYMGYIFIQRNHVPEKKQDKIIFEEFSLIGSAMAIMIHIAMADGRITDTEYNRIVKDMYHNLAHGKKSDSEKLKSIFGRYDAEIIQNMMSWFINEFNSMRIDMKKIITDLNTVYKNDIEKRKYIIQLCFYCAYADGECIETEETVIFEIARKLNIQSDDLEKIREQVKKELEL
ncbi:TerB family tellurite resistance protein [bacterium]|nr:TerB family tellurite resistance protein [bacterium]